MRLKDRFQITTHDGVKYLLTPVNLAVSRGKLKGSYDPRPPIHLLRERRDLVHKTNPIPTYREHAGGREYRIELTRVVFGHASLFRQRLRRGPSLCQGTLCP